MTDLKAASFPMNVIATRRSFLEKNRDVVKRRFLQAYSEATYQFMTNKQKAMAIYNQRLKQKDASVVEETYRYFAAPFSFPPRVSHEGMRVAIEMLAQRSPGTKLDMNVDKYVDERLLDELEREGLFKKISGKS
jgi:ABC-type nitrate/sulfonate/bicarbonate transport system substrate-binding protein